MDIFKGRYSANHRRVVWRAGQSGKHGMEGVPPGCFPVLYCTAQAGLSGEGAALSRRPSFWMHHSRTVHLPVQARPYDWGSGVGGQGDVRGQAADPPPPKFTSQCFSHRRSPGFQGSALSPTMETGQFLQLLVEVIFECLLVIYLFAF